MNKNRLATYAWIGIAAIVLLYAPMAIEYTARLFGGGPELWNHVFAQAVGDEHALGAGSIHAEQQGVYNAHRWVLLLHTTLGGTAIALAVFQLSNRSRLRIAVHRRIGRIQSTLALTAMLGAMAFLVLAGPEGTFDGPAFYLQLWALALATVLGTSLGWIAIRRGHLASHRILMTYAFAMLCTAPFLRLLYILLGVAWPDSTQQVTNLAGGAIEAVWAPLAAVLASRFVRAPGRREHLGRLPGAWLEPAAAGLAVVSVVGLAAAHLYFFDGVDRITITAVTAYLLGLAVTGLNHRATRDHEGVEREDWRIHHTATLLGLPATGVLWAVYTAWFTTGEGYYGALLTGPAVTISLGLFLVAWRRRRPARQPAAEAALVG